MTAQAMPIVDIKDPRRSRHERAGEIKFCYFCAEFSWNEREVFFPHVSDSLRRNSLPFLQFLLNTPTV